MTVKQFFAKVQRYLENAKEGKFVRNPRTDELEWKGVMIASLNEFGDKELTQSVSKSTIRCSILHDDMQAQGLTKADFPLQLSADEVTLVCAGFDCTFDEDVEYILRPASIARSKDGIWLVASYASTISDKSVAMRAGAKKGL